MKKVLIPTLLALSPFTFADSYQFEAGAAYSNVEAGALEVDTLAVDGRYFFSAVDDSKGPLSQAAFLNKSSNVGLFYADGEEDTFSTDIEAYGLDGRYVTQSSSFIFEASYSEFEFSEGNWSDDESIYSLGFGAYLDDASTLIGTLRVNDSDDEYSSSRDTFSLDYKLLHTLSSGSNLNIEAGISHTDYDDSSDTGNTVTATFLMDYFFSNNFSAGGVIGLANGDEDTDGKIYGVQAEYFFTNKVSLEASFLRTDLDELSDNINALTIGINGRF